MSKTPRYLFIVGLPISPNPLPPHCVDTQLFGGVVFPKPPRNGIMAKYPRETPKTLDKAIKNNRFRYLNSEKQPFHGMNSPRQMLKTTTFSLFFSKPAVFRKIIWLILIAMQARVKPIAHNNSGRKPVTLCCWLYRNYNTPKHEREKRTPKPLLHNHCHQGKQSRQSQTCKHC